MLTCHIEAPFWSDAAVVVCNSMQLRSPMQSYVVYGLQSGRQQRMLLVAYLVTSMTVRHALDSTLVVKTCGRSRVSGLHKCYASTNAES